jgi:hypothetical protein
MEEVFQHQLPFLLLLPAVYTMLPDARHPDKLKKTAIVAAPHPGLY